MIKTIIQDHIVTVRDSEMAALKDHHFRKRKFLVVSRHNDSVIILSGHETRLEAVQHSNRTPDSIIISLADFALDLYVVD